MACSLCIVFRVSLFDGNWRMPSSVLEMPHLLGAMDSLSVRRKKKKEEKNMKRTNCKCDVKMDMQPTRFATSLTFLLKLFIHWKKKKFWEQKKKNGRPSSALVNLRKGNRVSCKYILDIGDWKWHYCYCIAMQAEFCFCALLPLTLLVVCTICELMDCGAIEIMLSSIIC